MKKLLYFLLILTIITPFYTNGQNEPQPTINAIVKGRVEDSVTKVPLGNVSIQIKGVTNGTTTDDKGTFTLTTGQKLPFTLIITSVGYEAKEIIVNGSPVNVLLKPSFNQLEDVVVVGYGTQKRKDLTGSISSVSEKEFQLIPKLSLDNGLKGLAAGVQVSSTSNQPGGAASIRLRGANSINTGSEPLYVIDGFPISNSNETVSGNATIGASLNALSLINPDDIETIQVLKDASATSIYGSRGANGVILITTKRGSVGKAFVTLNSYAGIQQVRKKLDLLNAAQYAALVNDANGTQVYTAQQIASFGKGTDWQNEIFRKAFQQSHQLSVSGGNAKTKYYGSLNYFDQDGIIINSDFRRYSARFNLESSVTDKLTVGWNLSIANTAANQAYTSSGGGEGTQGVVVSALDFSPILPVYYEDGSYVMQSDRGIPIGNPVATAKELTNQNISNRTLGNVYANLKIAKGLFFKSSFGGDILNSKEKFYAPRTVLMGYSVSGLARASSVNSTNWLTENTFTYTTVLGKHSINAVAGFTAQNSKTELLRASASGFVNDILKADNMAAGSLVNTPVTTYASWSLASFLARVNYNYEDRFLATVAVRRDGSSKFGVNNKFGYFPSGAIAWRASKENFIKNIGIFDDLKIRLSYGVTGNQEIGSYQSLATLTNTSYIIGDHVVKGFAPSNIPNPNLKWESTAQSDIGLDASFLKGHINFTFDAYYKKTKDMLLYVSVPYSTGFSSALQNIGSLQNKGLEFSINVSPLSESSLLQWNIGFNISSNRNKVLSLGPISSILTGEINGYLKISNPIIIETGMALNSFYGYVSDGIFQLTDDIKSSAQPTAVPGDRKYKDIFVDGVLNANDRTYIGNANPKYFGGLSNSLQYKPFELNAVVNFVQGNSILNSTRADLDLPTGQKNSSARVANRWTPTNPSNEIPRANLSRQFLFSSAQIEDGSYLRLGTLTLAYNIAESFIRKIGVSKLRLYVTAVNLFTHTKYTGYDPEVNQFGQSNILRGIDSDAYPSAKTYLLGLNVTF